jgi:hypothetical protein
MPVSLPLKRSDAGISNAGSEPDQANEADIHYHYENPDPVLIRAASDDRLQPLSTRWDATRRYM